MYDEIKHIYYSKHNTAKVLLNGLFYTSDDTIKDFNIKINNNVKEGEIYIPEAFNYLCDKQDCLNKNLQIEINNVYFTKDYDFKITKLYNKKNLQSLLKLEKYDDINGSIFINQNDYNKLYYYDSYQASVFAKDMTNVDSLVNSLDNMNFNVYKMEDMLYSNDDSAAAEITSFIGSIIVLVVLFAISSFVVILILNSRKNYYSILRMIGCSEKACKHILELELIVVSNTAYLAFILLMLLDKLILKSDISALLLANLKLYDFIIFYLIVMTLTYLISLKYANTIFKKSVMDAARIEV